MHKRTSTPSKNNSYSFDSILLQSKKQPMCIQTDVIEKYSKSTNTPNSFDDIIMQGNHMNDNEFEKFVKSHAPDCYWQILAERTRIKLEGQLRENRQLHELLDELTKENEKLQSKSEQCEYLTNIFNSIMSEHDSGIELHIIDESPASKRQKVYS
ncbi:unnamed protein product [Rotaria sp. Silwood1]|nr:unnamed protein product [Rotaria sp. Silwood1]CAF1030689.1 unnamed protein product [Rotaria sp. Silwood1]CAF1038445.1 unnamed protein product [Rotaria sp. Silwood1]CAF3390353.1 unnamed protein product [Rotaria sp. Silwood1]CAF3426658.1 unnamed protein product [Rotaria sp. Silwood1]